MWGDAMRPTRGAAVEGGAGSRLHQTQRVADGLAAVDGLTDTLAKAARPLAFSALAALFGLYLFGMWEAGSGGLYGVSQPYGPVSRSPLALISLPLFVSLLFLVVVRRALKGGGRYAVFLFSVSLGALFVAKLFVPEYTNFGYQASFGDTVSHIIRGEFVVFTGGSSAPPGSYLVWQPGFWYTFTFFVDVVFGPRTPFSPVFSGLMRYPAVFFGLIYLPVVYFLFRSYGLGNRYAWVAMVLFYGFSIWSFTVMASQNYGDAVYWLLLAALPRLASLNRKGFLVLAGISSAALVLIHQVAALQALVALTAAVTLRAFASRRINLGAGIVGGFLMFMLVWLTRVFYNSGTFANLLIGTTGSTISGLLAQGGPLALAAKEAYRPYPPYVSVIHLDEAYFVLVTLLPLAALSYTAVHTRFADRNVDLALAVMAATIFVFIPVLIYSGAATGGLDRITSALLPLSAYSLTLALARGTVAGAAEKRRLRPRRAVLSTVVVVALICISSIVFFSGWNFLSVPYAENYEGANGPVMFVSCHTPFYAGCTRAYLSQNGTPALPSNYLAYSYTGYINEVYAITGSPVNATATLNAKLAQSDVVYSNPFYKLSFQPSPGI